jgi:signal peptidase II
MPESGRFGRLAWLWLSVLVVVLDQLSKAYFEGQLSLYERIEVIPNLFSFLADHSGWQRWLFAAIATAVSITLVVWLKRLGRDDTWIAIALALILGGAIGNLYDRIVLGHVIDFVLVHWKEHLFPAFNLADSAITVGAVMLALDMFRTKKTGEAHV